VLADVNYALSLEAMTAISHYIEDRLIERGSDGRLFAGFQKLGNVRAQRDRYEALKDRVATVLVFGAPDRPCPVVGGNLRVVATTAPDVLEHWFVVSDSPDFPICLVAREAAPVNGRRVFRGFWSSNPDLVARVSAQCSVLSAQCLVP
jgi:DICT domain-containing protein